MKYLKLITTPKLPENTYFLFCNLGEDSKITVDLLISILNRPPQKGVTLKEMRRDLKLLDKLEDASNEIIFTDEEYKHLLELINSSEWAIKHKDILDFAEYFEAC